MFPKSTKIRCVKVSGTKATRVSKVSTVINIRSARSVESDHVRIRVSINRREAGNNTGSGRRCVGRIGLETRHIEPCQGDSRGCRVRGKKNSFPRFFVPWMAGNASRCSGQRWIEGEARTRIERSGGGNSFCPSRQKNYTRFFKIMRNFLTKPFSLSLIVTIICHNHTVYRLFFFFVEKSPCLESANCISIVTEQLDSDIESVRRKRTTFEEKCTSSLCFVLFHFFTFFPPSFPFQENGRKFYNKIEATGS